MPLQSVKNTIDMFATALEKLKQRGIFCGGWNKLQDQEIQEAKQKYPHVLLISGAPHEWLFPKCCAAIHHGGAGTLAATLRAGIPTVVYPVLGDQPFWAARVAKLGVGPTNPISIRLLSAENIASQLQEALQDSVKENAKNLGVKLREEDGVANSVKAIDKFFFPHPSKECSWKPDGEVGKCVCGS